MSLEQRSLSLLKEALDTQACRCATCGGPATREKGYDTLYCDKHGGKGPFKDLLGADWLRRVIPLLVKAGVTLEKWPPEKRRLRR
jgi:hypothetical protein